eukprot:TRINITY_DN863_c0_g1_i6.p2 TRINITY_DN863_c0_g1~~TRINITY_DN863_c0_g1_i6.p2  ORF type:complete len:1112 (+),score=447.26 TRINITY_DN863_c0_g1_i6:2719-6054(+)
MPMAVQPTYWRPFFTTQAIATTTVATASTGTGGSSVATSTGTGVETTAATATTGTGGTLVATSTGTGVGGTTGADQAMPTTDGGESFDGLRVTFSGKGGILAALATDGPGGFWTVMPGPLTFWPNESRVSTDTRFVSNGGTVCYTLTRYLTTSMTPFVVSDSLTLPYGNVIDTRFQTRTLALSGQRDLYTLPAGFLVTSFDLTDDALYMYTLDLRNANTGIVPAQLQVVRLNDSATFTLLRSTLDFSGNTTNTSQAMLFVGKLRVAHSRMFYSEFGMGGRFRRGIFSCALDGSDIQPVIAAASLNGEVQALSVVQAYSYLTYVDASGVGLAVIGSRKRAVLTPTPMTMPGAVLVYSVAIDTLNKSLMVAGTDPSGNTTIWSLSFDGSTSNVVHSIPAAIDLFSFGMPMSVQPTLWRPSLTTQAVHATTMAPIVVPSTSTSSDLTASVDAQKANDQNGAFGAVGGMGSLIGIIVGGLVLCCLLIVLIVVLVIRRRRKNKVENVYVEPRESVSEDSETFAARGGPSGAHPGDASSEMLDAAARKIQACWKGHLQRQEYRKLLREISSMARADRRRKEGVLLRPMTKAPTMGSFDAGRPNQRGGIMRGKLKLAPIGPMHSDKKAVMLAPLSDSREANLPSISLNVDGLKNKSAIDKILYKDDAPPGIVVSGAEASTLSKLLATTFSAHRSPRPNQVAPAPSPRPPSIVVDGGAIGALTNSSSDAQATPQQLQNRLGQFRKANPVAPPKIAVPEALKALVVPEGTLPVPPPSPGAAPFGASGPALPRISPRPSPRPQPSPRVAVAPPVAAEPAVVPDISAAALLNPLAAAVSDAADHTVEPDILQGPAPHLAAPAQVIMSGLSPTPRRPSITPTPRADTETELYRRPSLRPESSGGTPRAARQVMAQSVTSPRDTAALEESGSSILVPNKNIRRMSTGDGTATIRTGQLLPEEEEKDHHTTHTTNKQSKGKQLLYNYSELEVMELTEEGTYARREAAARRIQRQWRNFQFKNRIRREMNALRSQFVETTPRMPKPRQPAAKKTGTSKPSWMNRSGSSGTNQSAGALGRTDARLVGLTPARRTAAPVKKPRMPSERSASRSTPEANVNEQVEPDGF